LIAGSPLAADPNSAVGSRLARGPSRKARRQAPARSKSDRRPAHHQRFRPRRSDHSPRNSVNPPRFAGHLDIKLPTGTPLPRCPAAQTERPTRIGWSKQRQSYQGRGHQSRC
jgi:hypothetical protein